jgi:hypothetical protein
MEQHAIIAAALADICLVAGIEIQSPEGHDTARLLRHLYKNGHHSVDELQTALSPDTLQALFG